MEERPSDMAYWRGSIDARLIGVDTTVRQMDIQLKEMRVESSILLRETRDSLTQQVQHLQEEMRVVSRMVYRIIGIGLALAVILPLIWPKFFPGK